VLKGFLFTPEENEAARLSKFISGGINSGKKYKDMYKESTGLVPLTKEFTKYAIDLSRFKNN
jgi:hypothetical protein